jgi:hypothetical protein
VADRKARRKWQSDPSNTSASRRPFIGAARQVVNGLVPLRDTALPQSADNVHDQPEMGSGVSMDISLRLPSHWLGATQAKGKGKGPKTLRSFVNTVMSYTKMDVPTVELYETAVTFAQ